MRVFAFILIAILAIMMVVCYALMVMAHDADERAERMYEKWKEEHGEREGER